MAKYRVEVTGLPEECTGPELARAFSKYSSVNTVLPPTRDHKSGIVIFTDKRDFDEVKTAKIVFRQGKSEYPLTITAMAPVAPARAAAIEPPYHFSRIDTALSVTDAPVAC